MAKIISFANQKGGVGKSTLTSIFANYLYLEKEKKVIVFDCDFQKSMIDIRESEIQDIINKHSSDEVTIKREDVESMLFKIVAVDPEEIPVFLKKYENQFDYILIDVPGNITQEGVENCYYPLDYMFIPFNDSDFTITSTMRFIELYTALKKESNKNTEVYGVLNKVNPSTKRFKDLNNFIKSEEFPIKILENYLVETDKLKSASTAEIVSAKSKKQGVVSDNVKLLCDELFSLIK